MNRILVSAAIAASLVATMASADAASRTKRQSYDRGTWSTHSAMRAVGPPWASPNQCFTDDGYGRFSPCDSSRR